MPPSIVYTVDASALKDDRSLMELDYKTTLEN